MKTIFATVCLFLFAGCAAETGQPPEDKANRADPAMEGPGVDQHGNAYTITRVKVGPDGRQEAAVYTRTKTGGVVRVTDAQLPPGVVPAPVAAETAPGAAVGFTSDYNAQVAPCSDATVRLYDQPLSNCASFGCHEICFEMTDPNPRTYETGGIDFGHYAVYWNGPSWNSEVRAYWSGNMYSGLKRDYSGDSWKCTEWFSGPWVWGNAGTCGQNANQLVIMSP